MKPDLRPMLLVGIDTYAKHSFRRPPKLQVQFEGCWLHAAGKIAALGDGDAGMICAEWSDHRVLHERQSCFAPHQPESSWKTHLPAPGRRWQRRRVLPVAHPADQN